jgi:hypothetical protein
MPTIFNRGAARVAVMVALVALLASGCGGGTDSGGTQASDTRAATTQTTSAETNGLEQQSAAQVQQAAVAAFKSAKSVHVSGTAPVEKGQPAGIDLRMQGNSSTGTMELEGAKLQITAIGDTLYLKADQKTWETFGVPTAAGQLLADKWVKVRSGQVTGLSGFSLDDLASQMSETDHPLEPTVEQSTLEGRKVVVLSQRDGSKLYVANTGRPYPLRVEKQGADAGRIDLTEYNADFNITAPSDAVDIGQVG